ncbi:hypothetical protein D3C78_614520 [compost metagenome]
MGLAEGQGLTRRATDIGEVHPVAAFLPLEAEVAEDEVGVVDIAGVGGQHLALRCQAIDDRRPGGIGIDLLGRQ